LVAKDGVMPGLVPGIHVLMRAWREDVDGRGKPGHDDGTVAARGEGKRATKNFFINFVDRIFTTLFERPFTNVFDVTEANAAISCVYRACNAD
jgi:hypothetical protein